MSRYGKNFPDYVMNEGQKEISLSYAIMWIDIPGSRLHNPFTFFPALQFQTISSLF